MIRCSFEYDVKYGKGKENNTEIAVQFLNLLSLCILLSVLKFLFALLTCFVKRSERWTGGINQFTGILSSTGEKDTTKKIYIFKNAKPSLYQRSAFQA
jgi:hypothetical protein